jgi:hypothetical protein
MPGMNVEVEIHIGGASVLATPYRRARSGCRVGRVGARLTRPGSIVR